MAGPTRHARDFRDDTLAAQNSEKERCSIGSEILEYVPSGCL